MSDERSKGLPPATSLVPEPSGFGNTLTPVERACKLAQDTGRSIVSEFGSELERGDKLRTIAVFKRTLIPAGRPGRKREKAITEAHLDFMAGLRPPFLYEKHIPGFRKMNQYRREVEGRRLMDAIRTRRRRAAKCSRSKPKECDDEKPE